MRVKVSLRDLAPALQMSLTGTRKSQPPCFSKMEMVFLVPVLIYFDYKILGMGILFPCTESHSLWPHLLRTLLAGGRLLVLFLPPAIAKLTLLTLGPERQWPTCYDMGRSVG